MPLPVDWVGTSLVPAINRFNDRLRCLARILSQEAINSTTADEAAAKTKKTNASPIATSSASLPNTISPFILHDVQAVSWT